MNRVFKVSEDREILASEWGDNDNPLVIMLHGGGQTRHSWKGVAAKIAHLGFHVIAHVLRGHGESFWDHDGDYTFDAHRDDPLSNINLKSHDYFEITKRTLLDSKDYCNGKVVSILEGGYDLNALAESTEEHVKALIKF